MEDNYNETLEACPLCLSKDITQNKQVFPAWRLKDMEYFHICTCNECKVQFTNPRPKLENISKYYSFENYDSHNASKKSILSYVYKLAQNFMFYYKYSKLNKYLGSRVLDYGAGNGSWVNHLSKKGLIVDGLEIAAYAREQSKKLYNINLKMPDIIDSLKDKSFDSITGFHVFEHVYNPIELVKEYNRLIKNGGYLIIAVPNNNSFDSKYYIENWAAKDVPIHALHFADDSIKNFFESNGFALEEIKGLPLDSFYVSLLSEKIKKGSPIRGFLIGLYSCFLGIAKGNWSSKIYIFKKE